MGEPQSYPEVAQTLKKLARQYGRSAVVLGIETLLSDQEPIPNPLEALMDLRDWMLNNDRAFYRTAEEACEKRGITLTRAIERLNIIIDNFRRQESEGE